MPTTTLAAAGTCCYEWSGLRDGFWTIKFRCKDSLSPEQIKTLDQFARDCDAYAELCQSAKDDAKEDPFEIPEGKAEAFMPPDVSRFGKFAEAASDALTAHRARRARSRNATSNGGSAFAATSTASGSNTIPASHGTFGGTAAAAGVFGANGSSGFGASSSTAGLGVANNCGGAFGGTHCSGGFGTANTSTNAAGAPFPTTPKIGIFGGASGSNENLDPNSKPGSGPADGATLGTNEGASVTGGSTGKPPFTPSKAAPGQALFSPGNILKASSTKKKSGTQRLEKFNAKGFEKNGEMRKAYANKRSAQKRDRVAQKARNTAPIAPRQLVLSSTSTYADNPKKDEYLDAEPLRSAVRDAAWAHQKKEDRKNGERVVTKFVHAWKQGIHNIDHIDGDQCEIVLNFHEGYSDVDKCRFLKQVLSDAFCFFTGRYHDGPPKGLSAEAAGEILLFCNWLGLAPCFKRHNLVENCIVDNEVAGGPDCRLKTGLIQGLPPPETRVRDIVRFLQIGKYRPTQNGVEPMAF